MSTDIKLDKNDLPDDLDLGNVIAVDGEFMGLNVRRDPLCLIQVSSGNSDAHIIQLDRSKYRAPNLSKILNNNNITKIFHYGRADIAHIKYYLKTDTNNIPIKFIQISASANNFLILFSSKMFASTILIYPAFPWVLII